MHHRGGALRAAMSGAFQERHCLRSAKSCLNGGGWRHSSSYNMRLPGTVATVVGHSLTRPLRAQPSMQQPARYQPHLRRRRGCPSAEPPSSFSRLFNRDGESALSGMTESRRRLVPADRERVVGDLHVPTRRAGWLSAMLLKMATPPGPNTRSVTLLTLSFHPH